ncbi:MAG: hypothetical protein M3O74_13705 [Pseudomonadota bacterium]|nr:hypothetical protein [Pseudomonadota bacterium]
MKKAIFLFFTGITISSGAFAGGWNYTKWGMTADQVTAASGNKATVVENTKSSCTLEQVIPGERLDLKVSFCFSGPTKTLSHVYVHPVENNDPNCSLVEDGLTGKYGAPVKQERNSVGNTLTFRDAANGTVLDYHLSTLSHICEVLYRDSGGNNSSL